MTESPAITPYYTSPGGTLYCGDALEVLRQMPDESVQCCVTSPQLWQNANDTRLL